MLPRCRPAPRSPRGAPVIVSLVPFGISHHVPQRQPPIARAPRARRASRMRCAVQPCPLPQTVTPTCDGRARRTRLVATADVVRLELVRIERARDRTAEREELIERRGEGGRVTHRGFSRVREEKQHQTGLAQKRKHACGRVRARPIFSESECSIGAVVRARGRPTGREGRAVFDGPSRGSC